MKALCGGTITAGGKSVQSQVNLQQTYKEMVDNTMCSSVCPCLPALAMQKDKIT